MLEGVGTRTGQAPAARIIIRAGHKNKGWGARAQRPQLLGAIGMAEEPPVGRIIQGDAVKVLSDWPEGCVDLIFADPPFNIGYAYDRYRDDRPPEEYLAWTEKWIYACLHVLKSDGTFWIAIGDEYAAEIRVMMRRRASLRNWIIWHYTFGQNCTQKFNRCHTHLFYFVKDPQRFTFNDDDSALRVKSDRQLKYNDKRANPDGKLPGDVWNEFPRVCGTFKERVGWHPCQMPLALLERIVLACSNPGDLVLDPFAGSGTTLLAAARHGRRWVGVELSKAYATRARKRIAAGKAAGEPQPKGPLSHMGRTQRNNRIQREEKATDSGRGVRL